MKLSLRPDLPIQPYKSITELPAIDLPDFTVLTGVNGAGKTHLLSGISTGAIQLIENDVLTNNAVDIKFVTPQTLIPKNSVAITKELLYQPIQDLWNLFIRFKQSYPNNPISQPSILLQSFIHDANQRNIVNLIAEKADKSITDLIEDDFHKHYPVIDGLENDVFYLNFAMWFKRYFNKFEVNKINRYYATQEDEKYRAYLTDEQFFNDNGEFPWDFANRILDKAKLDYKFNSPLGTNPETSFELKLINTFNDAEINIADLSSGEKVLISLAFAMCNKDFDINFPRVLLMDEPDASLHPSMAKQFLDVIKEVFVEEKKVKVIITTHSPSTVALADEESLFVMNKSGVRIEKTTKDKALKILTAGVPSFSVNYENRRQVFVESPNDVKYYEGIYQKLSNKLIPDISLSFIASGDTRRDGNGMPVSSCDQVKQITDILRSKGNNFVWGIIDWDTRNEETEFIKVLKKENRYSIENYLFDPILVAALLLREKFLTPSERQELNLTNETYTDFKNLTINQLQFISDFVTQKVFPVTNTPQAKKLVKYVNGIEIEVSEQYLYHQGHELEDLILKAFPKLNEIKRKDEAKLKLAIIEKVIDDLPEFIPLDILELFQSIQAQ